MPQRKVELSIPGSIKGTPDAQEMLRVWFAGGERHVVIRRGLPGGTQEFGRTVAQVALNGAILYSEGGRILSIREALEEILTGFNDEVKFAMRWHEGGVSEQESPE